MLMTHSETDYDGDADDDSMNDGHTSANAAKEPTQKPPEIALKESSTPVVKTPPQSAKMDVNDYLITQQQRATAAKIKERRQTTGLFPGNATTVHISQHEKGNFFTPNRQSSKRPLFIEDTSNNPKRAKTGQTDAVDAMESNISSFHSTFFYNSQSLNRF